MEQKLPMAGMNGWDKFTMIQQLSASSQLSGWLSPCQIQLVDKACTHTHTHMHACTHACTCTHTHAHTYTHLPAKCYLFCASGTGRSAVFFLPAAVASWSGCVRSLHHTAGSCLPLKPLPVSTECKTLACRLFKHTHQSIRRRRYWVNFKHTHLSNHNWNTSECVC